MAINDFNIVPFGNGQPRWFLGTAVPSNGTYNTGDIIFNSAPTGSSASFWVCTLGSSAGGTWSPRSSSGSGFATSAASPSDSGVAWLIGDIVFNSAPAANAPSGWVATASGNGSAANFLPFGQTNMTYSLTTTATSGTLSSSYAAILLNPATTGTYSLPNVTAYSAGTGLFLKNVASGSVTLTPLAANGYDAAAITLAQYGSVSLKSFGTTNWYRQQ